MKLERLLFSVACLFLVGCSDRETTDGSPHSYVDEFIEVEVLEGHDPGDRQLILFYENEFDAAIYLKRSEHGLTIHFNNLSGDFRWQAKTTPEGLQVDHIRHDGTLLFPLSDQPPE